MIAHILGTGESLKEFKPDGNMTVGVNDIHAYYPAEYVVCVDTPEVFTKERLNAIVSGTHRLFVSPFDYNFVPNFCRIKLTEHGRSNFADLDNANVLTYSNNSPFAACCFAYNYMVEEIVIWGADFNNHPHFNGKKLDRAMNDFAMLHKLLKARKVNLYVGSKISQLSKILPIWQK